MLIPVAPGWVRVLEIRGGKDVQTSVTRGKVLVLIIIAFSLVITSVPPLLFESSREGAQLNMYLFCLVLAMGCALYRGHLWARYVLAVLFVPMVLACLLVASVALRKGNAVAHAGLGFCMAALFFAAGLVLLISPSIREFLLRQRSSRVPAAPPPPPCPPPPGGSPAVSSAAAAAAPVDAVPPAPTSSVPPVSGAPRHWSYEFSRLLLLFCLAFAVIGMFRAARVDPLKASELVGSLLGAGLWALLIGWFVWRVFCKKRAGTGLLWFSMVFSVFAFQTALATRPERLNAKACVETMESFMQCAIAGEDIRQIPIDERTHGKMAPVLRLIRDWVLDMQREGEKYRKEMETFKLGGLLEPSVLEDPERIADARTRLKGGIEATEKYFSKFLRLVDEMPRRLADAKLPSNAKAGMLAGMRESLGPQRAKLAEFQRIETGILLETDAILEFMSRRQGHYSFEDGQLLFETDNDMQTYNEHFTRLQRLSAEEEAFMRRLPEDAQRSLEKLKRLE